MKFYHIDTFSGIGGFALAANWVSTNEVPWETIAFCECDKFCKQILAKHWPDVPCIDDINDVAGIVKVVGEYHAKETKDATNSQGTGQLRAKEYENNPQDSQRRRRYDFAEHDEVDPNPDRNRLQEPRPEQQASRSGQPDEDTANSPSKGLQGYDKQPAESANPSGGCTTSRNDYKLILTGGFPCQPFSVAGRRQADKDDKGRYLFPQLLSVIKATRPDWLVLENVPGITQLCFQDSAVGVASQTTLFGDTPDEIADFDTIIGRVDRDLRETGYEIIYFSIPAVALGAPHLRQRIFIVGHLTNSNNNGNGQLGESRNSDRIRSANLEEPESRTEHTEQPDQYVAFPAGVVANSEDMLGNGSNDNSGIGSRLKEVSQPRNSSGKGNVANSINDGCERGYPESGREKQGSQQRRMQQSPGKNSNVANTDDQRLERFNQQCCPSQFWGNEGLQVSGYADSANDTDSQFQRLPQDGQLGSNEQTTLNTQDSCPDEHGNAAGENTANSKSRKSRKQTEQERRESVSGADNYAGDTQGAGATAEREILGERERNPESSNSQRNNGSDKRIPNWDEHWYSVATRLCTQTPARVLPLDDGFSGRLARFACNKCSTNFNVDDYDSNTVTCPHCKNSEGIIENEIVEPDLPTKPKGWRINALKATGNAVVPQICLEIFRSILSAEMDYVADP